MNKLKEFTKKINADLKKIKSGKVRRKPTNKKIKIKKIKAIVDNAVNRSNYNDLNLEL